MRYANLVKECLVDRFGDHKDWKIQDITSYVMAAHPGQSKEAVRKQIRRVLSALIDCKVVMERKPMKAGSYTVYRWCPR